MIRAVIDTNVVISSIFWSGPSRKVIDLASGRKFAALTSIEIIKEIEDVLFEDFDVSWNRIEDIIRDLLSYSEVVVIDKYSPVGIRDLKDNMVIDCAVCGKSDYIITGDKDLKIIKEYRGIHIISPSDFLHLI